MRPTFRILFVFATISMFTASTTRAQETVIDGGCYSGDCGSVSGGTCGGNGCFGTRPYTEQSQADIFYNYYVPNNNGAPAAAFPAPYPTPSHVGHVYYTYQPLMPNEFLYQHRRTYHQYYNNGMGLNRTRVSWYHNPFDNLIRHAHKMTVWR